MKKCEFKDKIFEIINETEKLSIADIDTNYYGDRMNISLNDGSVFEINIVELNWLIKVYKICRTQVVPICIY